MDSRTVFIPGNTPSLKNSKIKTKNGIFHSKTVSNYLKNLGIKEYSASRKILTTAKGKENIFLGCFNNEFLDMLERSERPIRLGFYFIRDSRRKFDFNNANQIVLDLLSAANIINDDNIDEVVPFPLRIESKYYHIDKNNPGVLLKIL